MKMSSVLRSLSQHWVAQGTPLNIVPREAPPTMDKVPSIFAEKETAGSKPAMGTAKTTPTHNEGEELMETDELEMSICDNLVVSGRQ